MGDKKRLSVRFYPSCLLRLPVTLGPTQRALVDVDPETSTAGFMGLGKASQAVETDQ